MDWILSIAAWFDALVHSPGLVRAFYSAVLGVAVFISARALYTMIAATFDPIRRRVQMIQQRTRLLPRNGRLSRLMEALGARFMPKSEAKRRHTEAQLRYANFRSERAVRVYYGIKVTVMVLAPLAVLAVAPLAPNLTREDILLYMVAATVLGLVAPDYVLKRRTRRHQARLQRGLPDAMDLLVVCSEAGLGLNASIQRVASELALTHRDLANELTLYSMQARAGMDNRNALTDLKERTGVEDIQTLVAMLLQSMRFGTSIADTLRIYSSELRDKRLQEVEEKAAKVGVLMLFPMVTCILPSFLLVILGPPILAALRALG